MNLNRFQLPEIGNAPRARGCHAHSDIDRRLDSENELRIERERNALEMPTPFVVTEKTMLDILTPKTEGK
jgi:hypothetical protein